MIKLKGVHKVYSMGDVKVHALRGIDMNVKKGDFVSIMGPSGSGKSTMLHIIGVLDRQTKGSVHIKSVDVAMMSDEDRTSFRLKEIGFVFQFYSLLPELTALENIFIPNMLAGMNGKQCRKNAREMMEKLGIGERLSNYPHQLSGGEQQRVSIARALVNKPELLLADEPTASLDSKSAMNVISILRKLNEEIRQTIVLITHEQSLGALADRGIWLKDGAVEREKDF
ncbi:MAG: ABC transporter ATP-binding protein [Candidatus Aenigmarchaeota archaeon]|nr:ABC transporter ATP-binding protein [Candidatus Aenigmarchaeota archaeon]